MHNLGLTACKRRLMRQMKLSVGFCGLFSFVTFLWRSKEKLGRVKFFLLSFALKQKKQPLSRVVIGIEQLDWYKNNKAPTLLLRLS